MASTTIFPPGPLRAKSVSVSAGGIRILKMVDLTLHPGEMCALIGPSGAGKSTLIKALLGLRDPNEGSVMMGRHTVAELGPVGYVPQLRHGVASHRHGALIRIPKAQERLDHDASRLVSIASLTVASRYSCLHAPHRTRAKPWNRSSLRLPTRWVPRHIVEWRNP